MLDEVLGVLLAGASGQLGRRADARRAARLRQQGLIECSLRVLDEPAAGDSSITADWDDLLPAPLVTPTWRFGTAAVTRGQIKFEGIVIAVREVRPAPDRWPSRRESWSSIRPGSRILQVHSHAAALEWAIPAEAVDWALQQLQIGQGLIGSA
jgi:hypothetical protein